MLKRLLILAAIALGAVIGGIGTAAAQFQPNNPECIAPANPGGGWDFICRTTARFLSELDLIDDSMQVTNMAGGGGGIAFAHVAAKRSSDNNLIVAASNATTLRLAQGAYGDAKPADVRFLATFGSEYGAVAVHKDSAFKNLTELLDAVLSNPRSVAWGGGSAVGGHDHINALLPARAAGLADIRQLKYVSFDGGGSAVAALLSGAVQAVVSDFSELRGFAESGDIKVLAILAPERLTRNRQYPTAKEQGYDVIGANWRGFYMPRGASDAAYRFWTEAIEKMTQSPKFRDELLNKGIEPFNNFGADMDAFVAENLKRVAQISEQIGIK